jgi:biotin carboxyl carrier protein
MNPATRHRAADLQTTPNNPEQLDQVVRTTTVRGWIALGLAVFAVVVVVVWAFVATIPRQVEATAVVSDPDSVHSVIAGANGAATVSVAPGDQVKQGQEVARVAAFGGGSEAIDAPVGGRVRDVLVNQGQGVEPTDQLLTIGGAKPPEHPRLVTFLPESEAVLYRGGAEVSVQLEDPATVGTTDVPARISYVADVPSPFKAVAVALHSVGLAAQLHGDADEPVYRVVMKIEGGLEGQTVEGQVAKVTNTYDRQHPIDLLFGDTSE